MPTTPNAGFAMVDSIVDTMWPRTVATPSATATTTTGQHHVLADVSVGAAIPQGNYQGFTQLNHTWTNPPQQVMIPTFTVDKRRREPHDNAT